MNKYPKSPRSFREKKTENKGDIKKVLSEIDQYLHEACFIFEKSKTDLGLAKVFLVDA